MFPSAHGLPDQLVRILAAQNDPATPSIFLALAISGALGRGVVKATLALSVTWWPGYCRLVEAQVLKMREENFVEGARVGCPTAQPRRDSSI